MPDLAGVFKDGTNERTIIVTSFFVGTPERLSKRREETFTRVGTDIINM